MTIDITPKPQTCCQCPLGRKLLNNEETPWYTCFITGRTHTSIMTDRPKDCPIKEEG